MTGAVKRNKFWNKLTEIGLGLKLTPGGNRFSVRMSQSGHMSEKSTPALGSTPKHSIIPAPSVPEMADFKPFPNFSTDVLHVGQEPEQWNSMAVVPPISMASTFKQFAPAEHAVRKSFCC